VVGVVVDHDIAGMVGLHRRDVGRRDVGVAAAEEREQRTRRLSEHIGEAAVERHAGLHIDPVRGGEVRVQPAHAEARDADRGDAERPQVGDGGGDVGEAVLVGQLPVPPVGNGPVGVTAAESVEQIRRGDDVALSGEALAHPQQLLGHAVAFHHDHDAAAASVGPSGCEEVGDGDRCGHELIIAGTAPTGTGVGSARL
jgi:hypothetical protein